MIAWLAESALATAFGGNPLGFLLGNLARDAKAVWSWITHASFWQLVSIGLGAWLLLTMYQRNDARHDRDSYLKQRDYYRGELQRVTSARNEQVKVSERTVTQVVRGQDSVRTIVKTIHDAPNPPDCRTPQLPEAAKRML
jgi:hypothetical protein